MFRYILLFLLTIAITGCNSSTPEKNESSDPMLDEPDNTIKSYDFGAYQYDMYLNDMPVVIDVLSDLKNNSELMDYLDEQENFNKELSDFDIIYQMQITDERIEFIENQYLVINPAIGTANSNMVVDIDLAAFIEDFWYGDKEFTGDITYNINFITKPANNDSGRYAYKVKAYETIPLMVDMLGYKVINEPLDMFDNIEISDGIDLTKYNVSNVDCQAVKDSKQFTFKADYIADVPNLELLNRCLLVANNTIVNDIIQLYFYDDSIAMNVGYYDNNNIVVDYYDYDHYTYFDYINRFNENIHDTKLIISQSPFTWTSSSTVEYYKDADFLETVFSYKVADVIDTTLVIASPFSNQVETLEFNHEIELVDSQNKTDFIIIKETDIMDAVTLWKVDRDLTKTEIKTVDNMDWLFVASNNQIWFSSEYFGFQELYTIDLMNNMTETKVVDDGDKLTFIYGWFVQGDKNYLLGEFDGVDKYSRIENNTLSILSDAIQNHEIFYKKYFEDNTFVEVVFFDKAYDTLRLIKNTEVSERNKRGALTFEESRDYVSVVMVNSIGQEEVVTFSYNHEKDSFDIRMHSNSLSKSSKPTEGDIHQVRVALENIATNIVFIDKSSGSHLYNKVSDWRLHEQIVYGEEVIDNNLNKGRFVVNYGFNAFSTISDRPNITGINSFSDDYIVYASYQDFSNVTPYKKEWSFVYMMESSKAEFYCEPQFNFNNDIVIKNILSKRVDDFKLLNNVLYLRGESYIQKNEKQIIFNNSCFSDSSYYG